MMKVVKGTVEEMALSDTSSKGSILGELLLALRDQSFVESPH